MQSFCWDAEALTACCWSRLLRFDKHTGVRGFFSQFGIILDFGHFLSFSLACLFSSPLAVLSLSLPAVCKSHLIHKTCPQCVQQYYSVKVSQESISATTHKHTQCMYEPLCLSLQLGVCWVSAFCVCACVCSAVFFSRSLVLSQKRVL